jgi:hypothetical protein
MRPRVQQPAQLLLPAAALLVVACGSGSEGQPERGASGTATEAQVAPAAPSEERGVGWPDVERRRDLLAELVVGTSAEQVVELLGEPDEIRREGQKLPWLVGAKEEWAYGLLGGKHSFAAVGLVLLDEQRKVLSTYSPTRPGSLREGFEQMPVTGEAIASPTGMVCQLERVTYDGNGVRAKVTLRNGGEQRFELAHDHTGIGRNLLVELFDDRGRLLCRADMLTIHSPFESDHSKWPVLVIDPGKSASEEVGLGWRWQQLGQLPPGSYRLRVAFPFEQEVFYPSNTVSFEIAGLKVAQ